MYRILDLIMSHSDFFKLKEISEKYERGEISLKEFNRIAKELMELYGKKPSDIWRYEYAVIRGDYEETPYLMRSILRFRRPIRRPRDWKHYDYHWIQVTVFTIDPRWTKNDVLVVAEQITQELPRMWNAMGGGVSFVPEYSVVEPEILTEDDGFTMEKYKKLKEYLSRYDPIARNPSNWENYRPPADFKNVEHILSHYIACGIEEDKKIVPEWELLDLLMVECPCEDGFDFPVSESLTVYAATDIDQRCWLWKKSGWRIRGGKYIPPAGGPPKPRPPGRPKKKKETVVGEKEKQKPKVWPNPLAGYDIYRDFAPKFWQTLKVCQMYGLNPIPLLPDSKLPAIQWKYLTSQPIKKEHLMLFKNPKYNIGIVAGYNNLMIVDIDVRTGLNLNTLMDLSPRGNHYYFFVDHVIPGVALKIVDGPCKGKSPIGIKGYGYVVAPGSKYKGKQYKWIKITKPAYVESDKLVRAFERYFADNYEYIKKLFEKHCKENEG